MNGHIDADGIAEYRAGSITGRREQQIAAHLAMCAQCASVSDRLAEVSLLLAAAPLPAVPDAVAARLQAAFDAESPLSSEQSPLSSEQTVVTPARSRFRLPRLSPLRLLAPVAALAVLAAGAFGLSHLDGSSASGPAVAAGSAAESGSSAASGAERAAAPEMSPPLEGSFATGHADEGQAIGPDAQPPLIAASSTVDFQADTLGKQMNALFQDRAQLRTTQATASLKSCVRTVAGSKRVDLVVSARYAGAPATVVFVSDGSGYQAIVAGTHCSATERDILATAVVQSGISTP
ncbi:MAG TPA: hypothetical protein VGG16_10435 [Streptosporangiaceae bacterium]